ncbi:MAG: hypothetical protein NXH75_16700, partial [Halobacteriovoraceae bacterium]|nr:hypothetical protein [Halobacteriovoraceae bacterium]
MSKKKSKFANSMERLKGKFSGLFKKSSKIEDDGELYDEEFYEDEVDYDVDENFNEPEYDDEEFAEETDPSFQQLNVADIKKQQIENGETPPDLPPMGFDDDEDD